jgi:predicted MFS family arabinose efflux permease
MAAVETASPRARRDGGFAAWSVTLIVFVAAVFAWGAVFYGQSFYLSALQARHGWSASLISTAILAFFLSGILATIAVGRAADRHGPAPVLALGALAVGGGIVALGRIDAPWQLFLVYPLLGAGYPALATATISGALIHWFDRRYGLALSLALSGASVGGALLPPLMVWLDLAQGFTFTTMAVGGATLAVLLPLAWALHLLGRVAPATAGAAGAAARPAANVLRHPAFWRITVASALALGAQVGFLSHQIPLLETEHGRGTAALMVSVTALSALLGRFACGALAAWLPLRFLAAGCYLAQAAGFAVLVESSGFWAAFAGSALAGLVVGAIVMLPPLLLHEAFGRAGYGRIYGLCNIGLYIGAGLGPAAAGWLRDGLGSYQPALWTLAAWHLAAVAVILMLRPRAGPASPA